MSHSSHKIIWILTKEHVLANENIVQQFFDLYVHEDNFPDEDEREEPDIIKKRLLDNSDKPNTNLIAYTVDGEVRGGAILEYYSRSECCLLTYVFIHKDERKSGIARKLIETDKERGITGLIRHIKNEGCKVRAVFFETNNPFLTSEDKDSMPPAQRLKVFYRLGAKRIDIDYIQPSLDKEKEPVTNLYLCTFPKLNSEPFLLEIETIMRFLVEFYYGLDALKGDYDKEYNQVEKIWTQQPVFETPVLNDMAKSLMRNEYAHHKLTYLKELPLIEEPQLSFERASICCEILIDETYFEPHYLDEQSHCCKLKQATSAHKDILFGYKNNEQYCVITHSFETDLFAYSYQTDPPYYTRCFNFPLLRKVRVRFPQKVGFVSEGRRETSYVIDDKRHDRAGKIKTIQRRQADGTMKEEIVKEIELNVYLNYSYFFQSEIRVWHLIFTSTEDNGINEIDIIKLMKFFSGSQESQTEHVKKQGLLDIKFVAADDKDAEHEWDILELFEKISGLKYIKRAHYAKDENVHDSMSIHDIKTGIVQIDTDFCHFPKVKNEADKAETQVVLSQLFKNLKNNDEGKKVTSTEVEQQYKDNKEAEYVFEAFCGITLGIFDYSRMGYEEVSDTLVPRSATDNSFLTINRGVLSSFGHSDNVLAAAYNTIGINPYLLVPSAVLAHNEYVSIDAYKRSMEVIDDYRKNENTIDLQKLETRRKEVQSLLNLDFLPNVFQYPTEQDLYEYGVVHRGITERINRTKANLEQIDDIIEESNAHLNHRYQFWFNILLLTISIFQIYEVVTNILAQLNPNANEPFSIYKKLAVLLVMVVGSLFLVFQFNKNAGYKTGKKFIREK